MKKTKWKWKCVHCGKRNLEIFNFQFDIPQQYSSQWKCSKCGKESKIIFLFSIDLPERIK